MRTIEIRTTQNVLIDYELASLRDRYIAYFLDIVIFYSSAIFLMLLFVRFFPNSFPDFLSSSGAFMYLFVMLCWMCYHFLLETFQGGQTFGKRIMSIKVVRVDGKEPSATDHFLRAVFMVMDVMFSGSVVAAVLIASSEKKQRFGDMAANTTVVRKKSGSRFLLQDILKIQTIDDYEVTYPEVRQLNEGDLLLIKNVIGRYEAYQNDSHKEAVKDLVKKLTEILNLKETPKRPIQFLKTLIRDYIVLTR